MNSAFSIPIVKYYPPDLDDTERDKIKIAELRAAQVIARKQSSVRSRAEKETLLLRDWVFPIFAAFSNLALNRAKEGTWPIHKADSESREFLKVLASSAGMNSPDAWMAGGGRIIRAEIQNEIEHSSEWKRHQEKLLDLVDAPDYTAVSTIVDVEALNGSEPKKSFEEASSQQPKPEVPDLAASPSQGIAEGAMVDLPELSEPTKLKLAILWDALRNKQNLTDEDVSGYDLGRQWLLGVVINPPHGMKLGGLNIGHTFEDRKRAAGWLGTDPSVGAAEAWFRGIDSEYWLLWCTTRDGTDYKVYAAWLDSVKRDIVVELKSIWEGRSAATDHWLENTCAPAAEKAISVLITGRISQAQKVAMNRLDLKARAENDRRQNLASGVSGTEPTSAASGAKKESDVSNLKVSGGSLTGTNINRLRKECGWSFDQLAEKTGLEKKLILGHVNGGKGAHPRTMKIYADAFTKALNRKVTVHEIES